jgi:hypothetical protein
MLRLRGLLRMRFATWLKWDIAGDTRRFGNLQFIKESLGDEAYIDFKYMEVRIILKRR